MELGSLGLPLAVQLACTVPLASAFTSNLFAYPVARPRRGRTRARGPCCGRMSSAAA